MRHQCNRIIKMYSDEWQALERLAEQTQSRNKHHGTDARQVAWQALIRRIARGELQVTEPNPYTIPPALDEAIRLVEEQQRQEAERQAELERLEEQRRRVEQHTEQKQAVRKMPTKLTQLTMELEPA